MCFLVAFVCTVLLYPLSESRMTLRLNSTAGIDHQAHARPPAPLVLYEQAPEFGYAFGILDGGLSHSHYLDHGPPVVTGKIVAYRWINDATKQLLSTSRIVKRQWTLGTTRVRLKVWDQTGSFHSEETSVTVLPFNRKLRGAMLFYHPTVPSPRSDILAPPRPVYSLRMRFVHVKTTHAPTKQTYVAISVSCLMDTVGQFEFAATFSGAQLWVNINGTRVVTRTAGDGGTGTAKFLGTVVDRRQPMQLHLVVVRHKFAHPTLMLMHRKLGNSLLSIISKQTGVDEVMFLPHLHPPVINNITHGIDGTCIYASGLDGSGSIDPETYCGDGEDDMLDMMVNAWEGKICGRFVKECNYIFFKTWKRGNSNRVPLALSSMGLNLGGVKFVDRIVSGWYQVGVTSLTIGPDGRFYVGGFGGKLTIIRVRYGDVKWKCKTESVRKHSEILGLAINPRDDYSSFVRVYATVNILGWRRRYSAFNYSMLNGQIVSFVTTRRSCARLERVVVEKLPVSDVDHGVNSLAFDHSNNLYVSIGSMTNGGIASDKFAFGEETPLTAAIVRVQIVGSAAPGATQAPRAISWGHPHLTMFATGIRNSFGLTFHRKHGLVCTDNGLNKGFGKISTSCTTSREPTKSEKDRLLVVREGQFYGFPNRMRSGECAFERTKGASWLRSSTPGIMEYGGNNAGNGAIVVSQFAATTSTGATWAMRLDDKSGKVLGMRQMATVSGIALCGGGGDELVIAQHKLGYLRMVSVGTATEKIRGMVPRVGLAKGGNRVRITVNGGIGKEVRFGDKICMDKRWAEQWGTGGVIECIAPAGKAGSEVDVVVQTGWGVSIFRRAYLYV